MSSIRAFRRDYVNLEYSIQEVESHYLEWVRDTRYMILTRYKDNKNEVFAVKCAKRGNDVYRSRVRRRFEGLSSMADELIFFNSKDRGLKKTRALWVTLTYDSKRCSFKEAWNNIGKEFNRFMSYIRKKVGKVSSCRVFESFENGYPHIHAILLFDATWFKVFRDRKGQFRVHSKYILAEGWHSNVDVKAMSSLVGGFHYLKKYLLKGIDVAKADSKGLKTLALCWAFMKRAFSVSGLFRRMLSEMIRELTAMKKRIGQTTLSGDVLDEEKFHVIGFVPIAVLGLKEDNWFKKLDAEQISSIEEYFSRPKTGWTNFEF